MLRDGGSKIAYYDYTDYDLDICSVCGRLGIFYDEQWCRHCDSLLCDVCTLDDDGRCAVCAEGTANWGFEG